MEIITWNLCDRTTKREKITSGVELEKIHIYKICLLVYTAVENFMKLGQAWWLIPIIHTTHEVEIGRIHGYKPVQGKS
jgi:hypothetical protein